MDEREKDLEELAKESNKDQPFKKLDKMEKDLQLDETEDEPREEDESGIEKLTKNIPINNTDPYSPNKP